MGKRNAFLAGVVATVVVTALIAPQFATGTHAPANKVVASGSKVVVMAPGQDVELLRGTLRTSKPEDLLLQVALECSILTQLITGGENAQSSTATGDIRVWVEFDGKIVAINDVSQPPQDPDTRAVGDDSDQVTFCNRTYSRTVTDSENPADGTDTIDDYISTKSSHSFNWMLLNAGSGVHDVVVKADLRIETAGDAVAEAVVGNRTLIVEPTKLANDASI